MAALLSKERIVAPLGFNRWRILPAVLGIELCIGQIYAFSVFHLPLSRALGITASVPGDWQRSTLGWTFTLAMLGLGLSAAVGGTWVETAGPRKSGTVAACCWGSGFCVAAAGVHWHQIALVYLGYGVLGGCGLGLGYLTPLSTLLTWFADRRGLATGLAIAGFGGGAILGAPLAVVLMQRFASPTSVGVAETFLVLGTGSCLVMLGSAFLFKLPPPGWQAPAGASSAPPPDVALHVGEAVRTPQFALLWCMLLLQVTAGIGVMSQASAMLQEVFGGTLGASAGAAFVMLLSLCNMGGRVFWASLSDTLGCKQTFAVCFAMGPLLYALVPWTSRVHSVGLFVSAFAVLMTLYGGAFATMPVYLAELFGTAHAGVLFGRLLTAHAAAAVAGPVLVNYLHECQVAKGVPPTAAYSSTMYLMAGVLSVGFLCNGAVQPICHPSARPMSRVVRSQP
jgi:MFS family permease